IRDVSDCFHSFTSGHLATGIQPICDLSKHSDLPKPHTSCPPPQRCPRYPNSRNTSLKSVASFATDSGHTLPIALLYTAKSLAYRNDLAFSPNLVASTRSKILTWIVLKS